MNEREIRGPVAGLGPVLLSLLLAAGTVGCRQAASSTGPGAASAATATVSSGSAAPGGAPAGQPAPATSLEIKPRAVVKNVGGGIEHLAVTSQGALVAAGTKNGEVRLWETASGKQRINVPHTPHAGPVTTLCFSSDGKKLVTGGADKMLLVWDVDSGKIKSTIKSPETPATIALSPDGATLALATLPSIANVVEILIVWDLATRKERYRNKPIADIGALAFSSDGRLLAMGTTEGAIVLLDAATGQEKRRAEPLPDNVGCLAFTEDGRALVAGCFGFDSNLLQHQAIAGGAAASKFTLPGNPSHVALSANGRVAVTTEIFGNLLHLIDPATGKQHVRLKTEDDQLLGKAALSADGASLAAVIGPDVKIWDVAPKR